jgi:prepilin-type N-terminal cleavage/methylation domain-containing protein
MSANRHIRNTQSGFTAVEMMIALLILVIITGGIFAQIDLAQQRAFSEQVKLDNFQEARDFVDQFFRDVNQIGYPNSRMVDTTSLLWVPTLAFPLINDNRLAVGLVKIDANEIRFEGDMNGDGTIQSIIYMINGSTTCALCLQRSQKDKAINADPLIGQGAPNWGTETNDVVTNPIFSYFKADGTQVTGLPIDITTGAATIASVKTIKISLTIRNAAVMDPKTHQPIETNFEGEVSLNNCSMAASGAPMSCN